jgi:hypothetical protein
MIGNLISCLEDRFCEKQLTTLVQLDIAGAFNNVNRCLMVSSIYKSMVDSNTFTIRNFSTILFTAAWSLDRVVLFTTHTGKKEHVILKRGVPQGSPFSPLSFLALLKFQLSNTKINIFNDSILPKDFDFSKSFRLFSYADDVTLLIWSSCRSNLAMIVKVVLTCLENQIESLDLTFCVSKSAIIVFEKNIGGNNYTKLVNSIEVETGIKVVRSTRVLGTIFDSKLNFDIIRFMRYAI